MYNMMGVLLEKKYIKEDWVNWKKSWCITQVHLMSMFNTCERQTDRYCGDEFVKCSLIHGFEMNGDVQQKESCNECLIHLWN